MTDLDQHYQTTSATVPTDEQSSAPNWTGTTGDKAEAVRNRPISGGMTRLKSPRKSANGAPTYSTFVNRKVGRGLAAVADRQVWTPNTVALSALSTFAGIALPTSTQGRIRE